MATHGLIGRERELTELRDMAAAARRRRGRLVLIAGEAGIGKSALVEQALDRPGRLFLRGAALPSGTAPLGPIGTGDPLASELASSQRSGLR